MATLKGQNFRILQLDSTAGKFKVIGMATSCSITLTNNTDDATTKDDTGLSSKPTTTNKSWQVQVDSLNVADTGALLTAIKSLTKFTIAWDETATTNNQTPESETFTRVGQAYLSDATFTFNDRENSAKSLTFSGTSALEYDNQLSSETIALGSYTKGQYVRLFLSGDNTTAPATVIAAARQLSLHTSVSLENSTTKDTPDDWQIQEPTALNYDISTTALVKGGDTITSLVGAKGLSDLETIYENGTPVKWQIANVSGDNQRTKGSVIASGSAVLTQLSISAPNRQVATYDAQLTGYGDYTVGS